MTAQADLLRSRRRLLAKPGGSHDRMVQFLARALPAGIGVIAAVMILAPLAPRGEISFLLDRNKVAIARERVHVDNAMYRGQDAKGRPFSVQAASAAQERAEVPVVQMTGLRAMLQLSDGPAEIFASDGMYNYDRELVTVAGQVNVSAPGGYRMQSNGVSIDLKSRRVVGSGGIAGAIPAGTSSANRIIADLEGRTVTLDGNARLRMTPGQLRMP